MNTALRKKIKALVIGAITTIGIIFMLWKKIAYFIIPHGYVSEPIYLIINASGLILCWFAVSFLVYKFPLYQVFGAIGLLVIANLAEDYMKFQVNPITIPLMLLFWLAIAYLILPEFFRKYKIPILSAYGATLSYFFIFRGNPNYFEEYHANFISLTLIPIPVLAALWFYEQWRWLKTLEAEKGKTELALLKSQINPHFFFNTLNNLYGLVIEKSEKAPEVVLKLSDMMRHTIYLGKEEVVPLRDEISYLENYIELHKIRYQKKVEISFQHDVQRDIKIAPLLFIILLENAFKHGVEKLRENAFIHVEMKSQENQLFFTIENNFDESTAIKSKGIGLENLKKRLAHSYPNRHELVIDKKNAIYKVQLNLELI